MMIQLRHASPEKISDRRVYDAGYVVLRFTPQAYEELEP
jgi:hypothetical protein